MFDVLLRQPSILHPRSSILVLLLPLLASAASGFATVRYVDANSASPPPPYTNWASAAVTIQDAVDAAAPGDEIVVANGTYATGGRAVGRNVLVNRVAVDKPIALRSVNGPQFTIIQGYKVPGSMDGCGDGAIRCVYLTEGARLSGFTLTNGATRRWDPIHPYPLEVRGGGLWCESGTSVVSNCVIVGNSASFDGGGAVDGTLQNCALTGNSAIYGGGASEGTLYSCLLSGNSAGYGGGGASCGTLHDCSLSDNSSEIFGGGVYEGTLYGCTLTRNSAQDGGAAYEATLYNCTLALNWAERAGGGASGGTLYNSIIYFNRAPRGANCCESKLEYSCTSPLSPGAGNMDADPRLASATRLSSRSPCVGAGSSSYAQGVDIDGELWANPPAMGADQPGLTTGPLSVRIDAGSSSLVTGYAGSFTAYIGGSVRASVWDFGDGTALTNQIVANHAWSVPGLYTVRLTGYNDTYPDGIASALEVTVGGGESYYVNVANPNPVFPYRNWESAATNIQDAIAAGSLAGRVVWVTNGVYRTGTVETNGLNRIALTNAVVLRSVNGSAVTVIEGGTNEVRCAYIGNGSVLSGFTLTKGTAGQGGGIFCEGAGTLTDCALTNNSAAIGGGAYRGSLYNCTLTGNSADAVYAWGGGSSDSTLYNCILIGNSTSGDGGGACGGTLDNCVLSGNSAHDGGGASRSTLNNCTLTGNSADIGGGAGQCRLNNCVVYFNTDGMGWANYYQDQDGGLLNYCCTTPQPTNGVANITNAPLFMDYVGGNLRLRSNSSCINAGLNAYAPGPTDLDGNPRVVSGTVDIGAYEFQGPGSVISYAWLQHYGLPTDGSVDATDPDADGHTTWQEWRCQTDPTNALSVLHLLSASRTGTNVTVTWQSVAGVSYFLERSTNLSATQRFTPLATNLPGQPGTTTFTDTNAAVTPRLFYRVGVP